MDRSFIEHLINSAIAIGYDAFLDETTGQVKAYDECGLLVGVWQPHLDEKQRKLLSQKMRHYEPDAIKLIEFASRRSQGRQVF